MANSILPAENKKDNSLIETGKFSYFLNSDVVKNKINEVIGGKDGQAFITNICSAVANNKQLSECENWSIVLSALQGGALKLSPQLQQYYLVPFNDKNKKHPQAQFQIGYKGFIQLAIRSGQYKNLNVVALKDGEVISYNPLTEELQTKFIEDEEIREKKETVGYYACFELINGFRKSIFWSKKKMVCHARQYSQAFKYDLAKGYTNSFWSKNFDEMAFKTLLRQLISKWGVMSVELQEAYTKDQAVIDTNGNPNYVDNQDDQNQEPKENQQEEPKNITPEPKSEEIETFEEF